MKKESDLARRVRILKALLNYNGQQMADALGISRQTLTNAIGPNPKRPLNDSAIMKLERLESDQILVKSEPEREGCEKEITPYRTGCPGCLEKDEEIRYLREALDKSNDNLKTANENLSGMIELMQAKNYTADLASTASGGLGDSRHDNKKKGA